MAKEKVKKKKTDDGPACACGRGDLYEEFVKNRKDQNQTDKEKKNNK